MTFDPWSDKLTPNLMDMVESRRGPGISVDQQAYKSPVTGEWVDGKAADREHQKKNGVRRIDPSEKKKFRI